MQQLPPSLERPWRKLRQHFQHARAFNVLYLFCSEPALVGALLERAEDYLQLRVRRQIVIQPREARALTESLDQLIASADDAGALAIRAPVWLDWSAFGSARDEDALATALTRLNATRGALETRFRRLLIVVLPENAMRLLGATAPDMWHIRTLTETLRSAPEEVEHLANQDSTAPAPLGGGRGIALVETDYPSPYKLWLEAERSATTVDERAALPLWVGQDALTALLERGALEQAAHLADNLRALAAERQNTRDLSVSWNKLGDVARARNLLDEAETAYGEGKALADDLYRAQPTPENTRDLWVSWNKLGDVARARNRLDEAEAAYREGKALADTLYRAQPTPQNTRDLSISWNKLGEVAHTRNRLDEAEAAYREGKVLRETLHRTQPTPESTRDLSISWERLGDVARARNRLDEAETAYAEAIALWRILQSEAGENRDTVRGEAVVLERLASVLGNESDRHQTVDTLSRAEAIWLRLATAFPDEPEFSESLIRVRAELAKARSSAPRDAGS